MKKFIALVALLLIVASCTEKSGKGVKLTHDYHNPETTLGYDVRLLFEVNGIKMYKFTDGSNEVYFTDRQGTTQSIHTEHYLVGRMQYEKKKNTIVNN